MEPKNAYYSVVAEKLISALQRRNFDAYYCENKEEAREKVFALLEEGSTISWGGSETLKEMGLLEALEGKNYTLMNRDHVTGVEERKKIMRQAFNCDYYVMSSNAITLDGELVNIDGTGNRIAAFIFGPRKVIVVAGINKITSDVESAMKRIRNYTALVNSFRLDKKTPCTRTGSCQECQVEDTICCQILVTRRSKEKNRIKVILVGESLGY